MRFFSAYLVAFSIVQGVLAALNRQTDISGYGIPDILVYNLETVTCAPVACDGIQPYEWVALPLFGLATVWFLRMPFLEY